MPTDWAEKVKRVIDRAEDEKYLEVIDDVVAGHLSAVAIKAKYRDPDLVISALSHVTRTVHGIGRGNVPPISEGGWRDPQRHNGFYKVAPGFAAAWKSVRRDGP
jgi:hypothetical protein